MAAGIFIDPDEFRDRVLNGTDAGYWPSESMSIDLGCRYIPHPTGIKDIFIKLPAQKSPAFKPNTGKGKVKKWGP